MNINIIIIFIIIDFIKLFHIYNKNIIVNIYDNFNNNYYNPNKIPYLVKLNELKLLNNDDIIIIKNILNRTTKNYCSNNKSNILSNFIGGNYSKKCNLYYNDFNDNDKIILDNIGNKMIPYFEKLKLGNSDFRSAILTYDHDSTFPMHYDVEPNNCYRTIFLIDMQNYIKTFVYIDDKGIKNKVNLNIGEGIFFRGSTTFHGIENFDNHNQLRIVIGWQYEEIIDKPLKNIKYLNSELRSQSLSYIIFFILSYIIQFALIINLLYYNIESVDINNNIIYIMTILLILYKKYITKKILYYPLFIKLFITCLVFCGGNIYIAILLFNYILITI